MKENMDKISKAFGAGIVFFSIVIVGIVGMHVDRATIALLGGTLIGLLVAVPAVLLVILIADRRRDAAIAARIMGDATGTGTASANHADDARAA